jgi:hypothetical protein
MSTGMEQVLANKFACHLIEAMRRVQSSSDSPDRHWLAHTSKVLSDKTANHHGSGGGEESYSFLRNSVLSVLFILIFLVRGAHCRSQPLCHAALDSFAYGAGPSLKIICRRGSDPLYIIYSASNTIPKPAWVEFCNYLSVRIICRGYD